MEFIKNKKIIITIFIIVILILIFGIGLILYLRKVHSTFENYYVFRGCFKLYKKTEDYGFCRTNTGQTIKIVKFRGKWFLGPFPCDFFCF